MGIGWNRVAGITLCLSGKVAGLFSLLDGESKSYENSTGTNMGCGDKTIEEYGGQRCRRIWIQECRNTRAKMGGCAPGQTVTVIAQVHWSKAPSVPD